MANTVTVSVRIKDQLSEGIGSIKALLAQTMGGAVIPLTGAVAALGVELAGAGAAAGAFGAAVYPQIANIKQVSTEQDAYNKAVSEYGKNSKQALTAQQKLSSDLSQLKPATRDTANAFINLKDKFSAWSDSLSGTTMPVFTHLLKGLTNVFPLLTPLVKSASAQFLTLSKRFEAFSKTDKFKNLVKEFSGFASGALKNVVSFVEKLAKAVAGFVTSAGFKNFLEQGKKNLPGVAKALQNVAEFIGKFIQAAGPLGGLQLKVFEILADTLNAIPTDVLQTLVPLLLGAAAAMKAVKLAMMGFEFIKGLVLGFQLLTGATLELDAAMDANPVGLIVIALAALVFGLIEAYKHVGWFRDAVNAVGSAAKTAFKFVVKYAEIAFGWIKDHWKLVLTILTGPIGLAVSFIVSHWDKVKSVFSTVFTWIKGHWKLILSILTGPIGAAVIFIVSHWNKIYSGVKGVINKTISAIKGLIGWIGRIVGKTINIGARGINTIISGVRNIINWVRRMAGKTISLGVRGASAAIRAVQSVINRVRNFVGKTISIGVNFFKGAGSKLASALGFAHGGAVGHAAEGGSRSNLTMVGEHGPELVSLPGGSRVYSNPDTQRMMTGGGRSNHVILEIRGGSGTQLEQLFLQTFRQIIQVRGGDVQTVLGR